MDHHGDICSDAASGSSYDWNILRTKNTAVKVTHYNQRYRGLGTI